MHDRRIAWVGAGLCLLVGGCGAKVDGPTLAPVSGTVTFGGKPLAQAQVLFVPDQPGGMSASGTTDANGHYALGTRAPGDGALLGKHKVAITARGPDKKLPEGQLTSGLPGSNIEPGDPLIPEKYFMPDNSGLEAEVKPGSNVVNFDLKE